MMTPLSNGLRALGLALALVMMGPMALARDYIVAVVEAEPITNLEVQLTARWRALLADGVVAGPLHFGGYGGVDLFGGERHGGGQIGRASCRERVSSPV